jgi:ATP-binding cassette subfamily B protein
MICAVRSVSRSAHVSVLTLLDVLSGLLTGREAATEVRAHGAGAFLLRHYDRLSGQAEAEQGRLGGEEARLGLAGDAASGAAAVLTYLTLGLLRVSGTIPLAVASERCSTGWRWSPRTSPAGRPPPTST